MRNTSSYALLSSLSPAHSFSLTRRDTFSRWFPLSLSHFSLSRGRSSLIEREFLLPSSSLLFPHSSISHFLPLPLFSLYNRFILPLLHSHHSISVTPNFLPPLSLSHSSFSFMHVLSHSLFPRHLFSFPSLFTTFPLSHSLVARACIHCLNSHHPFLSWSLLSRSLPPFSLTCNNKRRARREETKI